MQVSGSEVVHQVLCGGYLSLNRESERLVTDTSPRNCLVDLPYTSAANFTLPRPTTRNH